MELFELYAKIKLDIAEYEKGLDTASKKTNSFKTNLQKGISNAAKVGAAALGAATTAVVAFAKSSVETGMKFDKSMSQVAATMGLTVDEIDNLRQFALKMGSETAFSATEAADALNYMALAGYDAETSMQMLPNVLNLAAAGGMGLAYASDMVTDSQTALGLSIDETTTMVDQMAKTAATTNTSVSQLGDAILTVGGTAKSLKGGTTELNTVLGVLADNGIKGSEAGIKLRNIMLAMNPTTDAATAAFEQLGLQAYDSEGNLRGLDDIFLELSAGLEGMTDQEKQDIIGKIFNKTDLTAVNALLSTTSERWDEVTTAIDGAEGAAQQMANTQLDNLAGDITLFQSALEGAKIVISDQLTPTLRQFTQFGTEAIGTLSTAFKEGGLSGAMEALGTILSEGLNMVIAELPNMIDAGMQLLGALGQGLLDNLPVITDAAVEIILMLVENLSGALPDIVGAGIDMLLALVDGLLDAIPNLVASIPTIIASMYEAVLERLPEIIAAGIELVIALASGLLQAIPNLIAAIPDLIVALVDAFMSFDWSELGKNVIEGLKNGIINMWTGFTDTVKEKFTGFIDTVKGWFGIHSPSTVFSDIGTNLMKGMEDGIDSESGTVTQNMLEIGKNIVNGAWNGIQNMKSAFTKNIKGFFGGIVSGVKSVLGIQSPSKVFASIGKNMALGVGEGWEDTFDKINNAIEDDMAFDSPYIGLGGGIADEIETYTINTDGLTSNAASGSGSTTNTTQSSTIININVDGAKYSSEQSLAEEIAAQLQNLVDRRQAVWA